MIKIRKIPSSMELFGLVREFSQLVKFIFRKVLDPGENRLGLKAEEMYGFIFHRFRNTPLSVMYQGLKWVQTLTILAVHVPLNDIYKMFTSREVSANEQGNIFFKAREDNDENGKTGNSILCQSESSLS